MILTWGQLGVAVIALQVGILLGIASKPIRLAYLRHRFR